jgi:hypothetical protein
MAIVVDRGKSCIIAEIAGISYGGKRSPDKVLKEIAKQYAGCRVGSGGPAANVMIWTQVKKNPTDWAYGEELAEYIKQQDLGEVYASPEANNIHYAHDKVKMVRAYSWTPKREEFLRWYETQVNQEPPTENIYGQ